MNIVQLQEQLKNFSQDQLVKEMQMPSGTAPQFLVLGEIMRRQKMQQDFSAQQAKGQPQSTVAEDAIAAAGVPQSGLASMARALAPKTSMAENTGVQAMADGGYVKKMQEGGAALTDPAIRAMANRMGMSVSEYLRSVGEEQAARIEADAARRASRDRLLGFEPVGVSTMFPTQNDLNRKYFEVMTSKPAFARPEVADEPIVLPGEVALPGVPAALPGDLDLVGGPDAPLDLSAAALADAPETYFTHEPTGFSALPQPFGTGFEADRERQLTRLRGIMDDFASERDTAESFRRMREIQAPDRSGVMGTNADRSLGPPTSWDFLGATVNIDRQGNISFNPAAAEAAPQTDEETTTAEDKAAEDKAAAQDKAADAKIIALAEDKKAQDRETPTGPAGPGGGGGGIAGLGGMSSYEQELMDALKRREKAAEQDKWLALAQVGLNMMSSTQPTLLGAIGEAGIKGVEAARSARDQYDKDRLELLGQLEQSRMARAAASARTAGGGGGGGAASAGGIAELGLSAGEGRLLTQIGSDIDRLSLIVNDPYMRGAIAEGTATPEEEIAYQDAVDELAAVTATRRALLYGVMGGGASGSDTYADLADE